MKSPYSALGFFRGHVAHSQASGIVSLARLHGALGSFREACVFGTRGQVARSEGVSERGFRKWHVPKEAFGLGFGTSVVLRRVPKGFRLVSGTRGLL